MIKKLLLISFVLVACEIHGAAQSDSIRFSVGQKERMSAASILWNGHFGGRKEEPHNVYELMTQGGFRAPTSKNFDGLIRAWLEKHPKAEAILVYSIPFSTANPDAMFKSIWIIDGPENLNIFLVRNGGCPAGTMVLNAGDETPVSKEEYQAFESKVWEAQKLAKTEKLGIWAETQPKN